jgi:hypothetical protein
MVGREVRTLACNSGCGEPAALIGLIGLSADH